MGSDPVTVVAISLYRHDQPIDLGIYDSDTGDRGDTVVKLLCYKSEGRWFDP
jgi:hypothetical protein